MKIVTAMRHIISTRLHQPIRNRVSISGTKSLQIIIKQVISRMTVSFTRSSWLSTGSANGQTAATQKKTQHSSMIRSRRCQCEKPKSGGTNIMNKIAIRRSMNITLYSKAPCFLTLRFRVSDPNLSLNSLLFMYDTCVMDD